MQPATATKPVYKLKNWWIRDTHVYGQNIEDKNAHMRSTRIDSLRNKESKDFSHGQQIEGKSAIYQLVGARRRSFSE